MAQLWRAKVRLIETTISKKADSGNYSFVQLGMKKRPIGNEEASDWEFMQNWNLIPRFHGFDSEIYGLAFN